MISKRKITILMVLLVISAFIFSISGCQQQAAKKPPAKPVKMASEVKKYSKEPGISLYRTATGITRVIVHIFVIQAAT